MAGLITEAEVRARPGLADADSGELAALIDDASALVRLEAEPELDDADETTTPDAVKAVLVNMIRRGLHNPHGHTQESLGDYSYSAGGNGAGATVYLTRREARIVRRAAGKLGATTLTMTGALPLQPSEPAGSGIVNDDGEVVL
ncbi:MAG: hypothetical protein ACODAE_05570 [Gemmatimonadota bacterium]